MLISSSSRVSENWVISCWYFLFGNNTHFYQYRQVIRQVGNKRYCVCGHSPCCNACKTTRFINLNLFFFANTAASVSSLGALFFANEGEREAQVTGDEAQGIMDRRKKRGALRRKTHKFLNLQAHSYLPDVLLLISVPTPRFCWPWETWTRFLKSNKRLS